MDKKSIEHIATVHDKVGDMRVSLENIASEEQEAYDAAPQSLKAIISKVPQRVNAINDAVEKLREAEEALDVARSFEHSQHDMRLEAEQSDGSI